MTENKKTTSRTVQLKISGMTCAACSARIEKGLSKLAGVEKAAVNLASEKAVVTYDPAQINPEVMAEKIHDLGYAVVKDKVEFAITGMTCASCANRIETRLNRLEGVTAVVNFANETATVTLPEGMPAQTVIDTVRATGYDVDPERLTLDLEGMTCASW